MQIVEVYAFNERGDLFQAKLFETRRAVFEFLGQKYASPAAFGIHGLTTTGHYREAAIDYDFRPYMGKYLVENPDGACYAAWAPNKTMLRTGLGLPRSVNIFVYPTA